MKIYLASLLAFADLIVENAPPATLTMTIPAIIPAESIEIAAEQAKKEAFERWKPEEGWHTHQANIMVVTREFYDAAFTAHQAGILDTSDEEPQTFTWDS